MTNNNLSPDQISLLADAELNKACAERVMGWRLIDMISVDPYYVDNATGRVCKRRAANWSPATSLADAARCTEAMLAKGFAVMITSPGTTYRGDLTTQWNVVLYRKEDGARVEVFAAMEPRARAEACLRAAIKGGDAG